MKISFIIIGKNEGWKLSNCLKSVFDTISNDSLDDYEVIYIDSKSTDDSLERVKRFPNVKTYVLTSECNAAIARNVGGQVVSGDVLFFIDGDMELVPRNFHLFFSKTDGLQHPFMSGNLLYHYYDAYWKPLVIASRPHYQIENDIKSATTGGMFLINKKIWDQIGGMKSYLRTGEDGDLGLRLAKKGILLLRKKELLVHHHTISYLSEMRKWTMLKNGAFLFSKSCLYRGNIINKYCWKRMIRHDYSMILLFICILLTITVKSGIPFIFYFISLLPKTKFKKMNYLSNFIFYFVRDSIVLLGFFLYHPRKNLRIDYVAVI